LKFGEVSRKNLFVDRTKIESKANKYTFVWKKAVEQLTEKILEQAAPLVYGLVTEIVRFKRTRSI